MDDARDLPGDPGSHEDAGEPDREHDREVDGGRARDGQSVINEHESEDQLEPTHLIRRSHVVLQAGTMMLGAGTSALRVREVMSAVGRTVGIQQIDAQVTFTQVVLTVGRRGIFRTQVREVRPRVDAERISLLHEFIHALPQRATAAAVAEKLDVIERKGPRYGGWLLIPLVALACASVAVLSNGGWREVLAVLPASALGYTLQRFLTRKQFNFLAVVVTSAAVASGLYVAFAQVLAAVAGGPSERFAAGFVCASIFLIPGFPLVTAGLDLTRLDLDAGIPRLAYAAMVVLAIAIGVWVVASVSGISPDPVAPLEGHPAVVWAALIGASFLAVFGWATMFNAPLGTAAASGMVAIVGNVPRLLMLEYGVKPHVATFVACVIMGLACAVVAGWFKMTKIIMTVPTLLVTIPGSSALRTLIYFDQADILSAIESGVSTVLVVVAMVAGLSGARMLTDPEWVFTRPRV
ncbi:MAG: threonine/serine exporter family protein [Propioniciclava sp.]|uniref:threonine/serine ThrE exporter family protein n=1 Tax=Propioniciclava sp. TaxID=2038686 RepID=UPI0039E45F53